MSSFSFHTIVQKSVFQKALLDLTKIKLKHTKVKHIQNEKLNIQHYLQPNQFTISETKFAFHARTRMLRVRRNYGQSFQDKFCPVCKEINAEDTQDHLLVCEALVNNNQMVDEVPEYPNLFREKIKKFVKILRILRYHQSRLVHVNLVIV